MQVLHIVERLHRGAVENWLIRMLRHARATGAKVHWTFYCALGQAGQLDDEARSLGVEIVYSPVPVGHKLAFFRALRAELQRGNYDALHCHHDLVSGLYLAAALGLSIRKRIVHVHNADEAVLTSSPIKKRFLRPALRRTCMTLATDVVGISNHTLDTFLAGRPRRPSRDHVHYYGIDPAPFLSASRDRIAFRRELDLAEDAKLLLFAGRIVPEKNPVFAVEVLAEMVRRDPTVAGIFVGSGSMETAVRNRAEELGIEHAFRSLGWRDDIPEIMACCDWFILPRPEHPKEGLGIAVIEAQLAGLRLLLSQGIPDDPILAGSVWCRLALAEGAERWADEAIRLGRLEVPQPAEVAGVLGASPFDMNFALRELCALHAE